MDFYAKKIQPLPFFMTHPGYYGAGNMTNTLQDNILWDMEYLQQTYPDQVKKYQRKIAEILDKMDYEGSMIYDEYPDRYCLQRLAKTMVQILQKEEGTAETKETVNPEKQQWLEALAQILLCDEIYKRRHGGRRGFFTI